MVLPPVVCPVSTGVSRCLVQHSGGGVVRCHWLSVPYHHSSMMWRVALVRPVNSVDVASLISLPWVRPPVYPPPVEMAAYQCWASLLSSHSSTTLVDVVSSQDTPAAAVAHRTCAAFPQPSAPPDCTVTVCSVPAARPANTRTTLAASEAGMMSSVHAPPLTLALYLVASSAVGQDTDTLFEVAVHDRAGAAMSARVVQYTPAKCWALPSLTASTLTQYLVDAARPPNTTVVDAVRISVCALFGTASWTFAE